MTAATRLQTHSISSSSSSSQLNLKNVVGIYLPTTTTLCSIIHRQQTRSPTYRGRREPFRREMFLFNGSSLPLSRLFNSCYYYTIHRTFSQVPFILSHPTWISSLQEKMLVDSNPYKGSIVISHSQIEELFALDRSMETVLDDCWVDLTRGLVGDVLERFRHAGGSAFRFFLWAGKGSGFSHVLRTYNTTMSVFGGNKRFESMVSLVDEMGDKGLLTLETFQICIKAFAAARQRRKAVGIFELMKKYNFEVGVDSINCLLDNLGRVKLGNLLEAGKVWNEMIDQGMNPDIVAYNTMLERLLKVHKRSDAVNLFEIMKTKGPFPNERSYTIMIRNLCKQKRMKEAVEYYENMLSYGCIPDAAVYTCLITGFGNQKQMDKVYGLLKEMKEKGCPPDG